MRRDINREAKMIALARLVIDARDRAKSVEAIEVQCGLMVTLDAITAS